MNYCKMCFAQIYESEFHWFLFITNNPFINNLKKKCNLTQNTNLFLNFVTNNIDITNFNTIIW